MKQKKTFLAILLVFALLLGGAYVLYDQLAVGAAAGNTGLRAAPEEDADRETAEPIPAPDFQVYDEEGNAVFLSDFFGKPIVLNFWASWCGPCQSEMPDFNEKYGELGDDVHFVMVNMTDGGRETVETASAYTERHGYEFPVLFDTESMAAVAYGAYSLPTSFFINADGHVIAQAVGPINAETLQKGIDLITA